MKMYYETKVLTKKLKVLFGWELWEDSSLFYLSDVAIPMSVLSLRLHNYLNQAHNV